MYEYFIRVPFANGTTKEILAGVTSFQPLYHPADTLRGPSSEAVRLEPVHFGAVGKDSPTGINYTAQISSLVFTEGSSLKRCVDAVTFNVNYEYQVPKIKPSL